MRIGTVREIKTHEYRVGLVPSGVRELTNRGHEVLVESGAGAGIDISDEDYASAGAQIAKKADEVFAHADMIVKVKEPQAQERAKLRPGQILFTYLHLAADPEQTADLVESGAVCIAYETITSPSGGLPLLAPMSEVAGRMSIQAGATCLEKERGGRGVLLGGVPGVPPADVLILGGGIVGTNAAMMALGMGANVTIVDRSIDVLRAKIDQFGTKLRTVFSTQQAINELIAGADLVIGAVLVAGAAAPKLVSADMISAMKPGAVVVDVAIDQGGCFETSKPTTHDDPTYIVEDVVHYCVANMPGAVAQTSTFALTNTTLPYVLTLAEKGYGAALKDDPHLRNGLNVCEGRITHEAVAREFGYDYASAEKMVRAA